MFPASITKALGWFYLFFYEINKSQAWFDIHTILFIICTSFIFGALSIFYESISQYNQSFFIKLFKKILFYIIYTWKILYNTERLSMENSTDENLPFGTVNNYNFRNKLAFCKMGRANKQFYQWQCFIPFFNFYKSRAWTKKQHMKPIDFCLLLWIFIFTAWHTFQFLLP